MSAPEPRAVRFSAKARVDYTDILLYSLREWGKEQRAIYSMKLTQALNRLAEFPDIGKPCDAVSPGLRSWPIEQHVIYYRVTRKTIRVVRIRHVRTDALDTSDL